MLSDIYQHLHGRTYSAESAEVALMVDLLLEAYDLELEGSCYSYDRERLIERARDEGNLVEDPNRNMSDIERRNTIAWQLALDFMFSHFDYTHE